MGAFPACLVSVYTRALSAVLEVFSNTDMSLSEGDM
jgi:hypothetical protein